MGERTTAIRNAVRFSREARGKGKDEIRRLQQRYGLKPTGTISNKQLQAIALSETGASKELVTEQVKKYERAVVKAGTRKPQPKQPTERDLRFRGKTDIASMQKLRTIETATSKRLKQRRLEGSREAPIYTGTTKKELTSKGRGQIQEESQRSFRPDVSFETTDTRTRGFRNDRQILESTFERPREETVSIPKPGGSPILGTDRGVMQKIQVNRQRSGEETKDVSFEVPYYIGNKEYPKGSVSAIKKPNLKWYQSQIISSSGDYLKKADVKIIRMERGPQRVLASTLLFGGGVAKGFSQLFLEPIPTVKGAFIDFPEAIIKQPRETVTSFVTSSPSELGETVGTGLAFSSIPGIIRTGKNIYIRAGSKKLKASDYFGSDILEGKKSYETVKTVEESVKAFDDVTVNTPVKGYERAVIRDIGKNGLPKDYLIATPFEYGKLEKVKPSRREYVKLQTSSPEIIQEGVATYGKKASKGYEDPGIYVSPKGGGMTKFFRLATEGTAPYEFSLNPFEGVLNLPTLSEFTRKGVKRYPRNIIETPGFEGIAEYQKSIAKEGYAYITKRSEIGFGSVKRQTFYNKFAKEMQKELGSRENEATLPIDSPLKFKAESTIGKLKGFDYYIEVEGIPIPVRKSPQLSTGKIRRTKTGKQVSKYMKEISPEKIKAESSYLYKQFDKKITPYDFIKVSKSLPKGVSSSKGVILSSSVSSSPMSSGTSAVSGSTSLGASGVSGVFSSSVIPQSPYVGGGSSGGTGRGSGGSSRKGGGSSGIIGGGSSPPPGISGGGYPGGGGKSIITPIKKITPPPVRQPIPRRKRREDPKKKGKGFLVEFKEGGRWFTSPRTFKNKINALSHAKDIADKSTSAQSRIKGRGQPDPVYGPSALGQKFRFPKRKGKIQGKGNTIIEKRAFRIDTSGELQGITAKGLLAQRRKRKRLL